MARRSWVQINGKLYEKGVDVIPEEPRRTVTVYGDLPDFVSPIDGKPMRLARSLVYPIDRLHVYASPLRSGASLFTEGHSRTKHSTYLPRAHVGLVSGFSSR